MVKPATVLLCLEVLAHSSIKETKLQWHLESKHEKKLKKNLVLFYKS